MTLPITVSWRRLDFVEGLEIARLERSGSGFSVVGHVVVVEEAGPWFFRYRVVVDEHWVTREVRCESRGLDSVTSLDLEVDEQQTWHTGEAEVTSLRGCVDVDLAGSIFTNTLPIRRLDLREGEDRVVRAAWVQVPGLTLEVSEQRYERLAPEGGLHRYLFEAVSSGAQYLLTVDSDGFVLDYERIARRVGRWP